MKPSKRPASPKSSRSSKAISQRYGGRATASGVDYEVRLAALLATKMLAGKQCDVWDGISGGDITAITLQAPEKVDDLTVTLRGDAEPSIYISAKSRAGSIPLTEKSPAFAETVRAFVAQFRSLPPQRSSSVRFIWAIPPSAGALATRVLSSALESHRLDGSGTLASFLHGRSASERRALDALIAEAGRIHPQQSHRPLFAEEEIRAFLRMVHVEVYEFETGRNDDRQARSDLGAHVVAEPRQARRAWQTLLYLCQRADERGLCLIPSRVRHALVEDGVKLKAPPDYAAEPHPQVAHLLVQTLDHLLPCAPREVFLTAVQSIRTSSSAGFQYDTLARDVFVSLIQHALADYRDLFQAMRGEAADCLKGLLAILDLFVEAGWPEARYLAFRLEEIYR